MKKTALAVAAIMALSTAVASAQSSQGNTGPGTVNNKSMNDPNARNDSGASNNAPGTTTGSSTSRTDQDVRANGMARNPSSQGNVGPGTNQGGAR